ncbi:MAG: hypothetical protein JO333_02105 [Verrucomicrobia bacterium]|nr:hypothetical protein [Verrucomicrobiota bacterium]
MNTVIRSLDYHLMGHCDCCGGYRLLKYYDQELGFTCMSCGAHCVIADIELNFGGYDLCRPTSDLPSPGTRFSIS